MRSRGIHPEPQRYTDHIRTSSSEHDRAVDAAAHRNRRPRRARRRAEDGADRGRESLDGELVTADGGRLEQRQAAEVLVQPVGVGVHDDVTVHAKPCTGPLTTERRVAEGLDHERTRARCAAE